MECHHMAAPFAAVWGPANQAVSDDALEDILLVTQCPNTTPALLQQAGKLTTVQVKQKLAWHLLG